MAAAIAALDPAEAAAADELRERMTDVFRVAADRIQQEPQTAVRLHESLKEVVVRAPLYLRHPLPNWPASFLFRKITRRFALPFLMPQVYFNESARDAISELTRLLEEAHAIQGEHERRIVELTEQIERLTVDADDRARERGANR